MGLLDKVCARINSIDVAAEAPLFASQLRKMRPSLEAELKAQGLSAHQFEKKFLHLCVGQLLDIKYIPTIASEMRTMLEIGSGEPALRCVFAASLANLVQPKDLLPDDLPGSYGFVDDAMLLHEACAISWEAAGNMKKAQEHGKVFELISIFVPDGRHAEFQGAINSLAMTLNLLRTLDAMVAEKTTQALVANPLLPPSPPAAAGTPGGPPPWLTIPGKVPIVWKQGDIMGAHLPSGGFVAVTPSGVYATPDP
jgi:uncharacterized membrane protein YkvA (DUF1232 family)